MYLLEEHGGQKSRLIHVLISFQADVAGAQLADLSYSFAAASTNTLPTQQEAEPTALTLPHAISCLVKCSRS